MDMFLNVGPSAANASDGTTIGSRCGRTGDQITSKFMPDAAEGCVRGLLYTAFVNAVTLAATHASPIAAGTGTPIIAIYNPTGSNRNIVIIKTVQSHTSGTPAGPLLYNVIPNPQNISAASTSPVSNQSFQTTGSVAKLFSNVALTGSTAGQAQRVIGGPGAIALGAGMQTYVELHNGEFIIPPGAMVAVAATGAGTAHILSAYVQWMEVSIPGV